MADASVKVSGSKKKNNTPVILLGIAAGLLLLTVIGMVMWYNKGIKDGTIVKKDKPTNGNAGSRTTTSRKIEIAPGSTILAGTMVMTPSGEVVDLAKLAAQN